MSQGWGCDSVVQNMLNVASVPSSTKTKKKHKQQQKQIKEEESYCRKDKRQWCSESYQ